MKIHQMGTNCSAFQCNSCKEYVDAVIRKTIVSLPRYLAISLLIFDQEKVNKKIRI